MMLAGSGRPRKACRQCKKLKIRCSGDKPGCKRCLRLKRGCTYDIPDSRKSQNQPRTTANLASKNGNSRESLIGTGANNSYCVAAPLSVNPPDAYSLGIPPALVLNLTEIYFSNAYNAHLLLHRPSFLKAITEGTAKSHIVLSACAWAAKFYQDATGQAIFTDHGFITAWARRAGALVFQEAENPHEDNIVTFMNLALFYYSQGMWRRAYIHKGNAIQLAYLLGLGQDRLEDNWETEIRRRRFWACYLMTCQTAEPLTIVDIGGKASELTLPWQDDDFSLRTPSTPRVTLDSDEGNGGIYCELARIFTIWSAVNTLLKSAESDIAVKIAAIYALDTRISKWRSGLPITLELTPSAVPNIAFNRLPRLLLIHAVYHQCLCALHSSIVPLFSWTAGDNSWVSARQVSAQIAFEHASQASALFEAVLKHYPMLNTIPSFVGYAAYCACAIHIPFLWCAKSAVRKMALSNVRTNIRMINMLSRYWKFTSLLAMYIRHLYNTHASYLVSPEDEPKYIDPMKLISFNCHTEHVANSILGFNRILWATEGGIESEEEPTNLRIDKDENPHSSPSRDQVLSQVPPVELQCHHQRLSPNPRLPGSDYLNLGPEKLRSESRPQQYPSWDFILPRHSLDPIILGVLPNGEIQDFDSSQFDPDPYSLTPGFFDSEEATTLF